MRSFAARNGAYGCRWTVNFTVPRFTELRCAGHLSPATAVGKARLTWAWHGRIRTRLGGMLLAEISASKRRGGLRRRCPTLEIDIAFLVRGFGSSRFCSGSSSRRPRRPRKYASTGPTIRVRTLSPSAVLSTTRICVPCAVSALTRRQVPAWRGQASFPSFFSTSLDGRSRRSRHRRTQAIRPSRAASTFRSGARHDGMASVNGQRP